MGVKAENRMLTLFIFLMQRKVASYRMIAFQGPVLVYLKSGYMAISKVLLFIRIM